MNEEIEDNSVETEAGSRAGQNGGSAGLSRKTLMAAAAAGAVIIVSAAGYWLLSDRESGKSVPSPRSVTFDNGSQTPTGVTGEQTITIPEEQIERSGIKVETVGETMSAEAASVSSTGVVQADAYRETPVISLLGGVVRRVNVELGQNVKKGQTLAVIFSDELAAAQSRYLALQAELVTARLAYERASALAELNPVSKAELDEATAKLKSAEAELDEHHRHHERTEKLLGIGAASQEEYEQAVTKMKTAEAEAVQARANYKRALEVARLNPVSRGEFEMAAVKMRTAEVESATARERLILLGLPAKRVDALRLPSQISSEAVLTAPVAGTVTARSINPGAVVEANKDLLKVTDLSSVWVIAQVYEKDLAKLRQGSGASVTSDAFPGRLFRGNVAYIDPNIDQQTRTVQVRIELANPGQILKVGMYVNATFGSMGNAESTAPVVPASAVQTIDNRQMVFAATDKPNVFALKFVRLGTESGGQFVVLEGLSVGDRIVTDGGFLLRAEWLKLHPGN